MRNLGNPRHGGLRSRGGLLLRFALLLEFRNRIDRLLVALVEIQQFTQFRLPREQFLQPLLMFEWPIALQLIVGEFLFNPHHAPLLVCSELVQTPQSVLDALDGPDWVDRVEVCGVRGFSTNEQVRNALVPLDQTERRRSCLC